MRFREWLARVMAGRYGRDQLNHFLSIVCIILLIVSMVTRRAFRGSGVFFYLALIVLILIYYRTFSRNYAKRAAENQRYLDIRAGLFGGFSRKKREMQDAEHAYFSCPNCRKRLRVPKGKGRISIHCPNCGNDFIKTT